MTTTRSALAALLVGFTALAAVPGALLETGPTGTNAGDLAVYLRAVSSGAQPLALHLG